MSIYIILYLYIKYPSIQTPPLARGPWAIFSPSTEPRPCNQLHQEDRLGTRRSDMQKGNVMRNGGQLGPEVPTEVTRSTMAKVNLDTLGTGRRNIPQRV